MRPLVVYVKVSFGVHTAYSLLMFCMRALKTFNGAGFACCTTRVSFFHTMCSQLKLQGCALHKSFCVLHCFVFQTISSSVFNFPKIQPFIFTAEQ